MKEALMHDSAVVPIAKEGLGTDLSLEEAMKILCPAPENRSPVLIRRIGRDKRGRFVYFDAERGVQRSNDWRYARELTDEEFRTFDEQLYTPGVLCRRQGPSGCYLFFHVDEQEDPVVPLARYAAK